MPARVGADRPGDGGEDLARAVRDVHAGEVDERVAFGAFSVGGVVLRRRGGCEERRGRREEIRVDFFLPAGVHLAAVFDKGYVGCPIRQRILFTKSHDDMGRAWLPLELFKQREEYSPRLCVESRCE